MKSSQVEAKSPGAPRIFVSCLPQDIPKAQRFIQSLESFSTNAKIYLSCHGQVEDQTTQQERYHVLDSSPCLLAFLAPEYLTSRICLEEFNIALAKQFCHNGFSLLPLHTGAVEQIPRSLSTVPCVDISEDESQVEILAEIVSAMIQQPKNELKEPKVKLIREKLEERRTSEFPQKFRLDGGHVTWNTVKSELDFGITGHVVFLCAQDCLTFAAILTVILKQHAPRLSCELQMSETSQNDQRLVFADFIVILVSDQFACSTPLNTWLHMALCRQQATQESTVVYIIQSQHNQSDPIFLHVLPVSVCLEDKMWRRLERACSNRNPRYSVNLDNVQQGLYRCTPAQNLALTAAAFDIIHTLSQRGYGSTVPSNVVSLAKVDNELKGLKDEVVSVHEHIISLDALSRTVKKRTVSQSDGFLPVSARIPSPSRSSSNLQGQNNPNISMTTNTTRQSHDPFEEQPLTLSNTQNDASLVENQEKSDTENSKEQDSCFPTDIVPSSKAIGIEQVKVGEKKSHVLDQPQTSSDSSKSSVATTTSDVHEHEEDCRVPSSENKNSHTRHFSITCQIV